MKPLPGIDMVEVTRLTREGRLEQAMRLLRGMRPTDDPETQPASANAPRSEDASRDRPDILDMEPPSAGNGGAWTAAPVHAPPPPPASAARASVLRSTLDRVLKPRIRVGQAASQPAIDVPRGARYEERAYTGAGGSRSYRVYVPSSYDATPRPLVVMLHGCTQSPDDFARGTRMNELAEEQGFLVAYPAQSQAANVSKCWNWFNVADQQRDRGEPALIAGITREIAHEFAVDPRRVYVAGLSAGGAMAAIMGATYPDLYAAVGVHSGLAPGAANDVPSAFAAMRNGGAPSAASATLARGVPTIVFHGDADATVHPLNAEHVAARARGAAREQAHTSAGTSAGGIAYTRTIDADADGRPLLEQWVLHGAGHAWSGGSTSGSFVEPRGPDASRAMLRFFGEHANTLRRD
jgi:poly(hydroxyalkanoate) depolymerase family esterase